MYAVNAVYDGTKILAVEPISVEGRYEVVVTFLRKINSENDMEFCEEEYNAETLAAMQEAEDIASGKIQTKSYKTVAEMEADLDAEEDE